MSATRDVSKLFATNTSADPQNIGGLLEKQHELFIEAAAREAEAEKDIEEQNPRNTLEKEIQNGKIVGPLIPKDIIPNGLILQRPNGGVIDKGSLKLNKNHSILEINGPTRKEVRQCEVLKVFPKEIHIRLIKPRGGPAILPQRFYLQPPFPKLAGRSVQRLLALKKDKQFWETNPRELPPVDIIPKDLEKTYLEALKLQNNESFSQALSLITRPHKLCGIKGPPGTGKTYLLALAVCLLINEHPTRSPKIIITSKGHKAVRNTLEEINKVASELFPTDGKEQIITRKPAIFKKGDDQKEIDELKKLHIDAGDWPEKKLKTSPWKDYQVIGIVIDALTPSSCLLLEYPGDYIFYEEAGQIPAYQIAATHHMAENLILAGDEDQLPPILAASHSVEGHAAVSGLSYLQSQCPSRVRTLEITQRLCTKLCTIIQKNYYPDINLQAGKNKHAKLIHKRNGKELQGLLVFDSQGKRARKQCQHEADLTIWKALHILENYLYQENPETEPRDLTYEDFCILTPFNAQSALIQNKLTEIEGHDWSCGTIHKMQGQGRPIVLSSLCTSNIHFMAEIAEWIFEPPMWNVTISRGMALCIITANFTALQKCEPKTLEGTTLKGEFLKMLLESQKQQEETPFPGYPPKEP